MVIGIIVILIIAVVIVLVYNSKKNGKRSLFETREVDIITAEEIVQYFKQEEIQNKLKENENLTAVSTKEQKDGKYIISCCLFDKTKESTEIGLYFTSPNIEKDLLDMFGEKSMIIFN